MPSRLEEGDTMVPSLAKMTALASVYVIAILLGTAAGSHQDFTMVVWPAAGLALAALLLFGRHLWPGVFFGALVANIWLGRTVLVSAGIAVGNTLEAVIAVYALQRFASFEASFDRLRHAIGLIVYAAGVSTVVSATFGIASLALGGFVDPPAYADTWLAWWAGHVLSDLVVAPLILTWASFRSFRIKPWRVVEAAVLAALFVSLTRLVFLRPPGPPSEPWQTTYVLFPLFIWAALRFELRGAATATAFVAAVARWTTARDLGPLGHSTNPHGVLALATYLASCALTSLVVAAAVAERARALRMRDDFVAMVSHELKNPLNALGLSTSLLLARPSLDEDGRHHAEKHAELVQRSVGRMKQLIGDLLDAAAIDAGHVAVNLFHGDVVVLVREAVEASRPQATSAGQTLHTEGLARLDVMCDRERVLQVLSNLISNAIKFTKSGGTITVRAERDGRIARVSVVDTGVGIAPEHVPHIFDRFWQVNPSANGGTGLGLAIAKGIVEAQGGKIWAHSRVGVGTTFCFTLPVSRHPEPPHARPESTLRS